MLTRRLCHSSKLGEEMDFVGGSLFLKVVEGRNVMVSFSCAMQKVVACGKMPVVVDCQLIGEGLYCNVEEVVVCCIYG